MKFARIMVALSVAFVLAGCESRLSQDAPKGAAAYKIVPPIEGSPVADAYQITPGDEVQLHVMDEPDLALDKVTVDQAGNIQVPLLGTVAVGGMSAAEATKLITRQLAAKYIRDPRVALNITTPVQRYVSVEGQVTKAGAYPVSPDTTLESAISMAQSPLRIARLDEVMVFRVRDGQRLVARFDLRRIRAGVDPDPKIEGGDVVVVGISRAEALYRDFITVLPSLITLAAYKKF